MINESSDLHNELSFILCIYTALSIGIWNRKSSFRGSHLTIPPRYLTFGSEFILGQCFASELLTVLDILVKPKDILDDKYQ